MRTFVLEHTSPDSDDDVVAAVQAESLEAALPMLLEIASKDLVETGVIDTFKVRPFVDRKLGHLPKCVGAFPVTDEEEFEPDFVEEWYHIYEVPFYQVK